MPVTFRQLEIFVEAAADANFRRTADRLGISQPAISKQIRLLEQGLGKQLFERRRGAAACLSAEGEAALKAAREALALHATLKPARVPKQASRLRVATRDYLLDNFIKPSLPAFQLECPHIELEFLVRNDRSLMSQVRSGEADLAVFTGQRSDQGEGSIEILSAQPYSLFATPAVAARLGADLDRIAAEPFILPSRSGASYPWQMTALRRVGIHVRTVAAYCQFGELLGDMVAEGHGIGMLFDDHVERRFAGRLTRLPIEIGYAHRMMILGKAAERPEAAQALAFFRTCAR